MVMSYAVVRVISMRLKCYRNYNSDTLYEFSEVNYII